MDITSIVNFSLLGLFIFIIFGLLISLFIGFKRGLVKSAYKLIFVILLIITAFATLKPITELIYQAPLGFIGKTIVLENTAEGTLYYVPVTNVYDTVYSTLQGYYVLFHVAGSSKAANAFALSLTGSIIKLAIFAVDMLLIVTLGRLFSFILWHIAFKHFVPKVVRKFVKCRPISMALSGFKYLLVVFLMLSPFTFLVNIANQSYQNDKNESKSEDITLVQNFLDTYNDSVFANTFFNWTTNSNGLTLDAQFVEAMTTTTIDGVTQSVVSEISTLTEIAASLSGVLIDSDDGIGFDVTALVSTDIVSSIFGALMDSNMVMALIPIAATLALNSDALLDTIDLRMVDMSLVDWKAELSNVEEFVNGIIDSGILNRFIDKENNTFISLTSDDLESFIYEVLDDGTYDQVLSAIDKIDESKLLSKAMPAVINLIATNDSSGNIAKFIPNTFDGIFDVSWGYESYVLLSSVKQMYEVDHRVVRALCKQFLSPNEEKTTSSLAKIDDVEEEYTLTDVIIDNIDSYTTIINGEFNESGELINVDKYGRTEVYDKKGNKIEGRNFCLMDMTLMKNALSYGLDFLNELPLIKDNISLNEDDQQFVDSVVDNLTNDLWCANYKKEFKAIFDVVNTFKEDRELVDALIARDFSPILEDSESMSKYLHIDQKHINVLSRALNKIDNSRLLIAYLVPFARSYLFKDNIKENITKYNIDIDLISLGLARCRDNKTIGHELCRIVDLYQDAGKLFDAYDNRINNYDIIAKISKEYKSIARVLDFIYSSELINPTPIEGDAFVKGENYFNAIEYGFSLEAVSSNGAIFHKNELLADSSISWLTTYDSNGGILEIGENGKLALAIKELGKTFEDKSLLEYVTSGLDFTKGTTYVTLEEGYGLSNMVKSLAKSSIVNLTLGSILDTQCERVNNIQIVDKDRGVTFDNVTDWNVEADNLKDILLSVGKIIDSAILDGKINTSGLSDVVTINDLLHSLASSSLFDDKRNGNYKFGEWLFLKARQYGSTASFKYKINDIEKTISADLFSDPNEEDWIENATYWGDRNDINEVQFAQYKNSIHSSEWEKTYFLSYRDFTYFEKEQWVSSNYTKNFDTSNYITSEYPYYYDNPQFLIDYQNIFDCDEISKVANALYYINIILKDGIANVETSVVEDALLTLNDSLMMRMPIYNIYEVLKKFASDNKDVFMGLGNLDAAYSPYLVSCDQDAMNYDAVKASRQSEIEVICDLYSCYRNLKDKSVFSSEEIEIENLDNECIDSIKLTFENLNKSQVFHRKGSYFEKNDGKYYPTVFQDNIATLYLIVFKNALYYEKSPKDILLKSEYQTYQQYRIDEGSEKNTLVEGKIDKMIDEFFTWGNESDYESEINEIDNILLLASAIAALDGYHGLKTSEGFLTTRFNQVDFRNEDNVEGIYECLTILNQTETLYDAAVNGLAEALDSIGNIEGLNLGAVNLYYQYGSPSGVVTKNSFDFTKKYSESDIETAHFLLKENCYFQNNDSRSLFKSLSNINECNFDRLDELLTSLTDSNIFHLGGPKKIITSSNVYEVDHSSNPNELTFLQDLFVRKIFNNSCFDIKMDDNVVGNYFYYSYNYDNGGVNYQFTSPKDLAHKNGDASGYYFDNYSKGAYYVKNYFDINLTINEQNEEVQNIVKTIAAINGGEYQGVTYKSFVNGQDLNNVSIENITNGEDLSLVLKTLNNSKCLRDIVPNALHYMFNNISIDLVAMEDVNLKDIDVYYHYSDGYIKAPNYNIPYPEEEIDAYATFISDYQTFKEAFGNSEDLNKISKLKSVFMNPDNTYNSNNVLYNVIYDMYQIKGMHLGTKVLRDESSTKLTVFEQTINQIVHSTKMDDYINDDALIKNKIKTISLLEKNNELSTTGYNDKWFTNNSYDQACESLIKFMFEGTMAMDKIGMLEFRIDTMSSNFNEVTPDVVSNFLFALNRSDIIAPAISSFVEEAFNSIHIKELTTYDSIDMAKYDLTQYQYGGIRQSNNIEYSEINRLSNVIESISKKNEQGEFIGYYDISQLNSFINESETPIDKLESLIEFSSTSLILKEGTFEIDGHVVDCRSLLMHNIFAESGDIDLAKFIIGDTSDEEIIALNQIYNLPIREYQMFDGTSIYSVDKSIEAKGLFDIIASCGQLDALDIEHVETIYNNDNNIELLENVTKASYDPTDNGSRSYLSSAIIGGLLDEIMNYECLKLDSLGYYYQIISFEPISFLNINLNDYDKLNENESLGFVNSLKLAYQVKLLGTLTPMNEEAIRDAFGHMVYVNSDDVKMNSLSANIVYLGEMHPKLSYLGWSEVPTDEETFYSSIYFDAYGEALITRMHMEGILA